ncbi:hypothetical protein ACFL34_05075, partial [Candidatus Sumerlaeota bacterium]
GLTTGMFPGSTKRRVSCLAQASCSSLDTRANRQAETSWIAFMNHTRALNRTVCLSVMAFAALYSIAYLQSSFMWWYEDDPFQYHYVSQIANPVSIFIEPQVLGSFGTGVSVVPMQLLSYWIDVRLFGISPRGCYLHSLLSLLIVTGLLYLVLVRFSGNIPVSACITLLWLFLPCTIAVHYFIGTRHYIEGLGWSLAACYWCHRLCHAPEQKRSYGGAAMMCASVIAAMLTKEIYLAALPTLLFIYAYAKRNYFVCIALVTMALVYIGYRSWIVGYHASYPVALLTGPAYLRYLAILPYTFAAGGGRLSCLSCAPGRRRLAPEPQASGSGWRPALGCACHSRGFACHVSYGWRCPVHISLPGDLVPFAIYH